MPIAPERPPLPLPENGLIAVLRAPSADHFVAASKVLWDAGISCFEYTLTTDGALDAVGKVRVELPGAVVGIGTARTPEHLAAAADVGADFAVSQVFLPELLDAAARHHLPYVPGTLTPTEVVTAWNAGVPAVKVSPIGPLGGVDYFTELTMPMPDVAIMPTGGVTFDDAGRYLDLGAVAVGVSGALFRDALLTGNLDALRVRAHQLVSIAAREPRNTEEDRS